MSNEDLLYDSQYDLRNNHTFELATIELIHRIKEDIDETNMPFAVF